MLDKLLSFFTRRKPLGHPVRAGLHVDIPSGWTAEDNGDGTLLARTGTRERFRIVCCREKNPSARVLADQIAGARDAGMELTYVRLTGRGQACRLAGTLAGQPALAVAVVDSKGQGWKFLLEGSADRHLLADFGSRLAWEKKIDGLKKTMLYAFQDNEERSLGAQACITVPPQWSAVNVAGGVLLKSSGSEADSFRIETAEACGRSAEDLAEELMARDGIEMRVTGGTGLRDAKRQWRDLQGAAGGLPAVARVSVDDLTSARICVLTGVADSPDTIFVFEDRIHENARPQFRDVCTGIQARVPRGWTCVNADGGLAMQSQDRDASFVLLCRPQEAVSPAALLGEAARLAGLASFDAGDGAQPASCLEGADSQGRAWQARAGLAEDLGLSLAGTAFAAVLAGRIDKGELARLLRHVRAQIS
jgi:hypothetical protein